MEKSKKVLLKLIIVLLSFISADGGRSFILADNTLQILMNHNQHNDVELPHNHHLVNLIDNEKWIDPICFEFISVNNSSNCFFDKQDAPVWEYCGSIWQPPKFI